jgi:hypothetical protein
VITYEASELDGVTLCAALSTKRPRDRVPLLPPRYSLGRKEQ